MTELDRVQRGIALARWHLSEAEVQALAGAIGNAGGPGLPRDGDAAWTQCWEHLIAARAALDALLTPAAPTPTGDA